MLNSFRQLTLDELNKEDLEGIAKIIDRDPETDPQFIYNKLSSGAIVPWRLETSKGNTILTIEVRDRKKERVLYIWCAAGSGLVGNGHYVVDTLAAFAKLNNCVALEAVAAPGFAKYLGRAGFEPTHVFVRKELD